MKSLRAVKVFCVILTITGLSVTSILLPGRAGQAASLNRAGSSPAAKPSPAAAGATSEAQARQAYGNLGVYFEANRGQVDARANFIAHGAGYSLFLTPTEAVYVLTPQADGTDTGGRADTETRRRGDTEAVGIGEPPEATRVTKYAVRMKIEGASAANTVAGLEELPGKVNYFRGNDPAAWQTNVPTFARVQYSNIYPGIDLVYYGRAHQLEYDFVVAPGVDAHQVSLRFEGADRVEVDGAGDLLLHAGSGVVRQQRPTVYQEVNGQRQAVQSDFLLKSDGRVGFSVGAYDSARPLIIDPTVMGYSTFLGSGTEDEGHAVAVDAAGNAYITGDTNNDLFPTTTGAFQTTFGGPFDAFVTKLNAAGTALIYSTYLGGLGNDVGHGIAVDAAGNAYVSGATTSSGASPFPTTAGAFQTMNGGPSFTNDAFLTKLNATGSALLYSTYLGGGADDQAFGIALDAGGNVYATGITSSNGLSPFPTTAGAFKTTSGGLSDAFVTKLNATGTTLLYSTYLGGGSADQGNAIAVDGLGNVFVTGGTNSSGTSPFPITAGVVQTTNAGGSDAFVTKLNASAGMALIYSTYLGGGGSDQGNSIAIDAAGNAYLTGSTGSSGATRFPNSSGSFQPLNGGGIDAFVSKLSPTGSFLTYSTYLGGGGNDVGEGIAVDAAGNAYVTGFTASSGATPFPTTPGALQTTYSGSGSSSNVFFTKFNAAGGALVYSTYLGGSGGDHGFGLDVDAAGNAYLVGSTQSSDFPVTDPAFQPSFGGGLFSDDVFVSKLGNYSISGRVIDSSGNPLGNVQMALSGARSKLTYTDPQGYFAFENTSLTGAGGDYNVVPARSGLAFTPTVQNISDFSHNVELFFTGFSGTPTGGSGGALAFTNPSFAVSESETTATITVTRVGVVTHTDPVTVDYFTSDGTASERSDYIGAAGTLTFNFGERTKTFSVLIVNNGYVRPTRTVNLILENPTNQASLTSPATAVLQINDNRSVEPPANPADDAAFFVRQQYYDFLDREPDADGQAYWTDQITQCGTNQVCLNARRRDVSAAFFVENEFQVTGYFVYLMNKSSFAEQPGYLRFSRDRARVTGGSSLEANKTAFAQQWVAREEFLEKYPLIMTDDNYVDALNLNAGAVLTATERAALINGLGNGTETRATVLRKIADNAVFRQNEYNEAFVLMQYFGYLRREVDQSGYNFWLDVLNNRTPGNFQGMVCAFISSAEYQDRFGSIHSHSNAECGQ